jgi:chromosome segregation protein
LRLKSIKVFGFKSFADKTLVEFSPGITVIVGPNGCGKSNIADAFQWVLGTQSARSLRGEKMEDFIFAGTPTRKPLNLAEVTLTLTDVDQRLSLNTHEVSIQRRIYRDGEAEYLLNGQVVRLKDIQTLLLDSGLSKDFFIGQGKVEELISGSPTDRRHLFEKVAGIERFKQRRKETLQRLEQVDGNLVRIEDIQREVAQQVIVLEQQSQAARQYKDYQTKMQSLEEAILLGKFWKSYQLSEGLSYNEKESITQLQQEQRALIQHQESLHFLKEEEKAQSLKLQSQYEKRLRIQSEQEIRSAEQKTQQRQMDELKARLIKLREEVLGLEQEKGSGNKLLESDLYQQKELSLKIEELKEKVQILVEHVQIEEEQLQVVQESQKQIQEQRFTYMEKHKGIHGEVKEQKVRLENYCESMQLIEQRSQQIQQRREALEEQAEQKAERVEALSGAIDTERQRLLEAEEERRELANRIKSLEQEFEQARKEYTVSEARHSALEKIHNNMEGLSGATQRLIKESQNHVSVLYQKLQPLYGCLVPEQGYEDLLATALRLYPQTLVVETLEQLKSILDFTIQNKLSDFSLICLEVLENQAKMRGKKNLSSDIKLTQNDQLSDHMLQGARAVDSIAELLETIQKQTFEGILVNRDGILFDSNQVLFYGKPTVNNPFVREAELRDLESVLDSQKTKVKKLDNELMQLRERSKLLEVTCTQGDQKLRRDEMKLVEENFAYQQLKGQLAQLKVDEIQFHQERQQLKVQISRSEESLSDLQDQYAEAEQKAKELQTRFEQAEKELHLAGSKLQEKRSMLQTQERELQFLEKEWQTIGNRIQLFEVKAQEREKRIQQLQVEIEEIEEKQSILHERYETMQFDLSDTVQQLQEAHIIYEELKAQVQEKQARIAELELIGDKIVQGIEELQDTRHRYELELAQASSVLEVVLNEAKEKYGWDQQMIIEQHPAPHGAVEEMEKEFRKLKRAIEQMGDVNLTSIEEYSQQAERLEFLTHQIGDLKTGKDELLQIITKLDHSSRKQFKETFDLVRMHFKKNFQILFNGGEADLDFVDNQDILEAGIEIMAKPPGKQMRSIQLLSGGEKCLTAMALLFAIFEVKPAPFCILDEIDAPLDETNVERFVNVVRQYTTNTQFIIISHNKRTMAMADLLFGVSMEEKGVSKLLSINFERARAYEEV